MDSPERWTRRAVLRAGTGASVLGLAGCTELLDVTGTGWDFEEDFEQYDVGQTFAAVDEWTATNYPPGHDDAFKIEEPYPDEIAGARAASPEPDGGNFQVDARNGAVDAWQYPSSGFRLRAVLSTEGVNEPPDASMPHVGVLGEGDGGDESGAGIELDTSTVGDGQRGLSLAPFDGDPVLFGEIDADTYGVELIGRSDGELVASARPLGDDDWRTTAVPDDFTGEIVGVYLNANNGGQFDEIRLREESDPAPTSS